MTFQAQSNLKNIFTAFYVDLGHSTITRLTLRKVNFLRPKNGFYHVVDNFCKYLQASGQSCESHNVLTQEEIYALYDPNRL